MIIRTLTKYQINELALLFAVYTITRIGRVDETRDIIVEYYYYDGEMPKTKRIPPNPETNELQQEQNK